MGIFDVASQPDWPFVANAAFFISTRWLTTASVASGMESGVREGYEQLDELLAK